MAFREGLRLQVEGSTLGVREQRPELLDRFGGFKDGQWDQLEIGAPPWTSSFRAAFNSVICSGVPLTRMALRVVSASKKNELLLASANNSFSSGPITLATLAPFTGTSSIVVVFSEEPRSWRAISS